ncbi:MAG: GTPase Era [Rhodospirillales bacterium]
MTSGEGKGGEETRAGFVAILGAPNVGKSTLLNKLVGTKVSIVSPKVQTTRTRVLGICIEGSSQVIFIDTPGIFQPRRRLDRAMVAAAWSGAVNADEVLLLVDSSRSLDKDTTAIIENLQKTKRRAVLALNKVDLVKKPDLLALAAELDKTGVFTEIFMISAETGDGVPDLMDFLAGLVPTGPWLFPEDQISDMPGRLTAAEITREQLYLQLRQELPYAAAVETESWQDQDDGSVRIEQVVYVERNSQKAIVLGKKGSRIKKLGEEARKELEDIFERRVHLFLFVKVREKWGDDPERYRDLGLDFDA